MQVIYKPCLRWSSELLKAMFHGRAETFGPTGLDWDVQIFNGEEMDEFDALDTVYGMALDPRYRGSLRLLPTTQDHLMNKVFHLYHGDYRTLEMSRLCADSLQILDALVDGAVAYGESQGFTRIITLTRPRLTPLVVRRYGGHVLEKVDEGHVVEFKR